MFIIENLANAVTTLLQQPNLEVTRAFIEDILFIASLSGKKLIENMELKGLAMSKLSVAQDKSSSPTGSFKLKTTPKIPRALKTGSGKLERPLKESKTKEPKKSKDKDKDKAIRDKKMNFIEKRQQSMPAIDVSNATTQEYYEEDSDDVKYTYAENYPFPKIKAASIDKLIERLTHEVYPGKYSKLILIINLFILINIIIILDIMFRNTFMLTYRSFMEPHQLLVKLDQRYFVFYF